jgi:hypothetical protein
VLLGTLALTGCASPLASRTAPVASGLTSGIAHTEAGIARTEEEQACAAQRSEAAVSAVCLGERQVARTSSAAGGSDAPRPERGQRSDILTTASDMMRLLSDTGGVARALMEWRKLL